MRYFLISYVTPHSGFGHITFESNAHPSAGGITAKARYESGQEDIVILNIYEFKSETDYKLYRGEEL